MGFNRLRLPKIKSLKKSKDTMGDYEFGIYWHMRLAKTDSIIGSYSSMEMVKQFAEGAYNVWKDNQKDKK